MLKPVRFALCAAWMTFFSAVSQGDDHSYFRHDLGVSDSASLPGELTDDHLAWKREVLPGHSTPCICGDVIVLTTYDEAQQELATVALERGRGEVRWTRVAPAEAIEQVHLTGSPASSTPACDGERIYSFFGSYGLLCYDLDGELLWSTTLGPFQDEFGAASSPILVDGKVILNEDHDINSYLVAIDQKSGSIAWQTPREDATRSYSTPIVWEVDGKPQIVVAGALKLSGYDAASGEEIWYVNGLSRIVDSTPVLADGLLYVATWTPGGDTSERISMGPFADAAKEFDQNGDGKIAKSELPEGPVLTRFFRIDLDQDEMLDADEWARHEKVFDLAQNVAIAVRPGARGDATETHVEWIYRRGLPTVPSPLVYNGVMYMVKDGGVVTGLDAKTGELLFQGRAEGGGNFYASPVAGDGKVYIAGEGGAVTVLAAGREWDVLFTRDFGERIMATPVLEDGRVYLRTEQALYCFE